MNYVDLTGRPFHFIGIGGIGMSALAYVLAKKQLPISGSDLRSSHITERLTALGAHVFYSHEAKNLGTFIDLDNNLNSNPQPQIVCSTAINPDNAEYNAAQEQGLPIFHRSDLLAALIDTHDSIAVAGTHGKTTTSSLMGYVLYATNLDPTVIIGGEVAAWEGNARLGQGKLLVAEADESDGSLVKHHPKIGIITNIELDHPDHYQDLEQVINTFQTFASHCQLVVGCSDCYNVRTTIKCDLTYGLDPQFKPDFWATDIGFLEQGTNAKIWYRGDCLGEIFIPLLGEHNVKNTLATIAIAHHLGLDFDQIATAIATFQGAKRRFEHRGQVAGITFIDDYAHHPSEINVTLAAANQRVNGDSVKRIIAVFQPHRYSRTLTFKREFATCFSQADMVIITDIYSAGEQPLGSISGQILTKAIAENHNQVFYSHSLEDVKTLLKSILQPGDMALFLGAGNLNKVIPELINSYENDFVNNS